MDRRIRLFYVNGRVWSDFESKDKAIEAVLSRLPADAKVDPLIKCRDCGSIQPLRRPGTDRYYDEVGICVESAEFAPVEKGGFIPDFQLDLRDPKGEPVAMHPLG